MVWLFVGILANATPQDCQAQEEISKYAKGEKATGGSPATPPQPAIAEKPMSNFAAEWVPPVKISLMKHARLLAADAASPAWTPDGKQILYRIRDDAIIAVMDLATKKVRPLVRAQDLNTGPEEESTVVGQRVSADGKTVVFARRPSVNGRKNHLEEEIWVIPLNGGASKFVTKGAHPTFGSDSHLVYFHDRKRKKLCSIRLDEKNAQPTDIFPCTAYYPVISPDGNKVVYSEGSKMIIREIKSGKILTQPELTLEGMGGIIPTWSADSRKICASGYSSKGYLGVWVHDLPSQQTRLLTVEPISQTAWSPNGKQLAFTIYRGRLETHLWNLASP